MTLVFFLLFFLFFLLSFSILQFFKYFFAAAIRTASSFCRQAFSSFSSDITLLYHILLHHVILFHRFYGVNFLRLSFLASQVHFPAKVEKRYSIANCSISHQSKLSTTPFGHLCVSMVTSDRKEDVLKKVSFSSEELKHRHFEYSPKRTTAYGFYDDKILD